MCTGGVSRILASGSYVIVVAAEMCTGGVSRILASGTYVIVVAAEMCTGGVSRILASLTALSFLLLRRAGVHVYSPLVL
jgi:hypothetical protein